MRPLNAQRSRARFFVCTALSCQQTHSKSQKHLVLAEFSQYPHQEEIDILGAVWWYGGLTEYGTLETDEYR